MQAATAAVKKKKDSYYHAKFPRIKRRQGSKRAFVAVAASMLTAVYYMIERDEDFRDLGAGCFDQFDRQKLTRHLIRRLNELGLEVQVQPRAA